MNKVTDFYNEAKSLIPDDKRSVICHGWYKPYSNISIGWAVYYEAVDDSIPVTALIFPSEAFPELVKRAKTLVKKQTPRFQLVTGTYCQRHQSKKRIWIWLDVITPKDCLPVTLILMPRQEEDHVSRL